MYTYNSLQPAFSNAKSECHSTTMVIIVSYDIDMKMRYWDCNIDPAR